MSRVVSVKPYRVTVANTTELGVYVRPVVIKWLGYPASWRLITFDSSLTFLGSTARKAALAS